MSVEKSALFLFLFLLFFLPFIWFSSIFPYKTAASFISRLPKIVDTTLIQQFPEDLVISVKNGQVSLNRPVPYCLNLKPDSSLGIVFDTESLPDTTALSEDGPYHQLCHPLVIVGRNFIIYASDNQPQIQTIPLQANLTLDRLTISDFTNRYLPLISSSGRNLYLVLPFLFLIPVFLFILALNFWYATVVRVILKFFKIPFPKNSDYLYGLTLFFFTILLVLRFLIFGYFLHYLWHLPPFFNIPFLNTIIITFVTVFYFNSRPRPTPPVQTPSPPVKFRTVLPPGSSPKTPSPPPPDSGPSRTPRSK